MERASRPPPSPPPRVRVCAPRARAPCQDEEPGQPLRFVDLHVAGHKPELDPEVCASLSEADEKLAWRGVAPGPAAGGRPPSEQESHGHRVHVRVGVPGSVRRASGRPRTRGASGSEGGSRGRGRHPVAWRAGVGGVRAQGGVECEGPWEEPACGGLRVCSRSPHPRLSGAAPEISALGAERVGAPTHLFRVPCEPPGLGGGSLAPRTSWPRAHLASTDAEQTRGEGQRP